MTATDNIVSASLKVGLAASGTLALTWAAAPSAMAQGKAALMPAHDPFNGFSLGLGASVDRFNTTASDYAYFGGLFSDGLKGIGGFGTAEIGKDFRFGNLVLGIYGEYSFGHKSDTFNRDVVGSVDSYNLNGSLRLGTEHSVTGRLGVIVNPQSLVYGIFGYSWQNYAATVSTSSADYGGYSSTYSRKGTLGGLTMGIGGEMMVNNDWSIKGEYRFTRLAGVSGFGFFDAGMATDKVEDHTFRAVLSFKPH
ncbi:MAG: outer membrane beta-barrel protein [Bauldia sp.]